MEISKLPEYAKEPVRRGEITSCKVRCDIAAKNQRITDNRSKEPCPDFYIPRITWLLANFMFSA